MKKFDFHGETYRSDAHDEPEASAKTYCETDEETKITLEQLCQATVDNIDCNGGDILGFAVYTDGGDTREDFDTLWDAINEYGNRKAEPVYIGGDYPASMTEPDVHGIVHVALVEAGQPAPQDEAAKFIFHRAADTRTPVERELDDLYQALDGCHDAYQNYYAAAARGDVSGWMTPAEIAEDEEAYRARIADLEAVPAAEEEA